MTNDPGHAKQLPPNFYVNTQHLFLLFILKDNGDRYKHLDNNHKVYTKEIDGCCPNFDDFLTFFDACN